MDEDLAPIGMEVQPREAIARQLGPGGRGLYVGHFVGDVMYALAALFKESEYKRIRRERSNQFESRSTGQFELDPTKPIAHMICACMELPTQHLDERQRGLDINDTQGDVIESLDQIS